MDDYIHINKAVRKYNKTRQTFYNYIKKWFVKTKKVNNKVYLLVSDIENLLNDYIAAQTIIEPNINKKSESEINIEWERYNENKLWFDTWVQNDIKTQTDIINKNTEALIVDLQQSIGKQLHNKIIGLKEVIENKIWYTNRLHNETQLLVSKSLKKQSKTLFWIYYLVFVSINVFIIRYIS